jgi:hypothetical protein
MSEHILELKNISKSFSGVEPRARSLLRQGKPLKLADSVITRSKMTPDIGPNILLGLPFVYNADNIDDFNW